MTISALLILITSEGTSSNVCELTPSGTSPVKSILLPPTFLIIFVMGETDVTILSFLVEVSLVLAKVELVSVEEEADEFILVEYITLLSSLGSNIVKANKELDGSIAFAIKIFNCGA